MGHSRQASVNICLMFPYSRRVMIVLRRSLYGVVSDGRVLFLFVPLMPAVLTGFPQGANISLEAGFGRIVFLSAVFVVFHSLYQSTLIPVPPSMRPPCLQRLSPHTLFLGSEGLDPPQAPTPNVESVSPVKSLLFAGGVFLDALLDYQEEWC